MFNVFMETDLEGISGIDDIAQVADKTEFALERLMLDVNAAIAGAFDGGADNVYIRDGHGGGVNFIEGKLDKRAKQVTVLRGGVDFNEINAVMVIGAHAMAGTLNAFLDHTQSSLSWHNYIVNGRKSGEIAQSAIHAGAYDIPCVMVSGDEAACVEAKQFLGDIECAVVKYAIGRNKACAVDLDEALSRIYNAAKNGIKIADKIRPYKPLMPMELILEYNRSDYCDSVMRQKAGIERLDARTVRKIVYEINDFTDVLI